MECVKTLVGCGVLACFLALADKLSPHECAGGIHEKRNDRGNGCLWIDGASLCYVQFSVFSAPPSSNRTNLHATPTDYSSSIGGSAITATRCSRNRIITKTKRNTTSTAQLAVRSRFSSALRQKKVLIILVSGSATFRGNS